MLKRHTSSFAILSSFLIVSDLSQVHLAYFTQIYFQSTSNEAIGSPAFTSSNAGYSTGTSPLLINDSSQLSKATAIDQQPPIGHPPHTDQQPSTDQQTPADQQPPTDQQTPADQQPPTDQQTPTDYQPHADHQPSTDEQPNTDHQGHADHQPSTDEQPSANKTIELSAHYIAQALKESKVFENFVNFELYKPYQLFYEVQYQILLRSGTTNDYLAVLVAESANEAEWVNTFVWFHAVGYMMADLLLNKGLLNLDIAPLYSQQILIYSESYAYKYGVYDTKSFFESVHNGCYDFLDSKGLINNSNLSQLYHSFAQYIIGLASCCKDMTF